MTETNYPVFKDVFGKDWDTMPPVMHAHYANRAYCDDETKTIGTMTIESSVLGRVMKPLFLLARTLVPYEGRNIPTIVHFRTYRDSDTFHFHRIFYFTGKKPYAFNSYMVPLAHGDMIEMTRSGFGWHLNYAWDGSKVTLSHRRFVFRFFKWYIPVPLGILIGRGYAEEIPVTDNAFTMRMEICHPWWGKVYSYSGHFKMENPL